MGFDKLSVFVQSKEAHVVLTVSGMLSVILWSNHVIGCLWYIMGIYAGSDTGLTWLSDGGAAYTEAGKLYEYTTALHWAITQMTPASMEVTPKSSSERIFTIVCI